MKKIFTLLGGMLLASTLSTNAMEVKVYIYDYDTDKAAGNSYKTNLTKDSDGNFVLENFLGETDDPVTLSFKFEKPSKINGSSGITFTSDYYIYSEDYKDFLYLGKDEDNAPDMYIFNYNKGGEPLWFENPYIYNSADYTYVMALDKDKYGYDYVANIYLTADDFFDFAIDKYLNLGDDTPSFNVWFYFNDPSEANQAAYEKVIEQIEAVEEEYNDAVAQIKEVNPEFDFVTDGWTEIASKLSSAKGYALMELNAANSDLADFNFAYSGEDEQGFIIEMKKAAFKEPNQKAYDDAVAELDELLSKYNAVMEDAKAKNPDYDFEGNGWLEVGSQIEQYKNFAAQALSMADEAGEYFKNVFYFDASEIEGMIEEMKKAVDDGTTGIGTIEAEVAAGNAKIFTLDGKSHNAPVKGQVNVIVKENSTVKVMVK